MNDPLNQPFAITEEQKTRFRCDGFVKLKRILPPELLNGYGRAITDFVLQRDRRTKPMEQRTTYEKAFLQITNLWPENETVKEFCFGKRLARVAAELMGTRGVRMYHDQALYKEPGGGKTPWHADQYYWPLSNANTCTAWIPLQDTPLEMGPLSFSVGSHQYILGCDLAISDESEEKISKKLLEEELSVEEKPYALGDVSFHYGWTFHRAGANLTTEPRRVMTVIYMDIDMRVAKPRNKNQQIDWEVWMPGAKIGDRAATPLNPVLYEATAP